MNDIMMIILKAVVSVATILITGYLIPLMIRKLDTIKDDQLKRIILDAVWAAQQTLTDNEEKKTYVLMLVTEWLEKNNIHISPEELDALIESTVLEMKVETK